MKSKIILLILVSFLWSPLEAQAANYCALKNNFLPQEYACLVVAANDNDKSWSVLDNEKADQLRYPASLTKLMTLYLTFSALQNHKIRFDSFLTASRHASNQPSMKINLNPGNKISVKSLIESLVVVSANDSAVVLAEKLGGTEKNFARLMTEKAHQLGMKHTNFINASGLYNPRQVTTAIDMAELMMAIKRDFPQYYHLLSLNHFSYKGIQYSSHTRLMKNYKWAQAAKTGFVSKSGFNLVLNAKKNNDNLIAVIMGGSTAKNRDDFMRTILDHDFNTAK